MLSPSPYHGVLTVKGGARLALAVNSPLGKLLNVKDHKANGLVCISGDTHYAERSMLDLNTPYPIWDLTSSGLTEVWHVLPPNELRVGEALRENNFGLIDIDWAKRELTMQVCDVKGDVRISRRVGLDTLKVG